METALADNPTRKKILLALKKNGSMSVEDLSGEVNITPMGVRQHLLLLEKSGAVEYITKKHGVGRPGFLYRLTETADDLFPKSYQSFAMDILTDIEHLDGKGIPAAGSWSSSPTTSRRTARSRTCGPSSRPFGRPDAAARGSPARPGLDPWS